MIMRSRLKILRCFYGSNSPYGIFVTSNGDVYVDNGAYSGQIDMCTSNTTNSIVVLTVTDRCLSLFIDSNNTLYCVNDGQNKVSKHHLILVQLQ